jgi:hypothetical protein
MIELSKHSVFFKNEISAATNPKMKAN